MDLRTNRYNVHNMFYDHPNIDGSLTNEFVALDYLAYLFVGIALTAVWWLHLG
jgi:hypothetical protein